MLDLFLLPLHSLFGDVTVATWIRTVRVRNSTRWLSIRSTVVVYPPGHSAIATKFLTSGEATILIAGLPDAISTRILKRVAPFKS